MCVGLLNLPESRTVLHPPKIFERVPSLPGLTSGHVYLAAFCHVFMGHTYISILRVVLFFVHFSYQIYGPSDAPTLIRNILEISFIIYFKYVLAIAIIFYSCLWVLLEQFFIY